MIKKIFLAVLFCCMVASAALAEEVRITRDDYGVPHIYAQTDEALFFGQGYAMACDRLFQLEMCRMSAAGEMAKYLGRAYLEYDKQNRRYFPYGEDLVRFGNSLTNTQIAFFKAFASGINERIKEVKAGGTLPSEFASYGIVPQEWSFLDVIRVIFDRHKYVYDNEEELLNASLLDDLIKKNGAIDGKLMFDTIALLNDQYSPATAFLSKKTTVSSAKQILRKEIAAHRFNNKVSSRFGIPYGIGSYASVIFPSRSKTGNSLLLAGPQVGFSQPPFYYECGLHGKSTQAFGIQSIGLPGLTMGQNSDGTWALTGGLDNQLDYFRESLNPSKPNQYWYKDSWHDFQKVTARIEVKDSNTYIYEFYKSVHGPIVFSDTSNPDKPFAYAKKCAVSSYDMVNAWQNLYTALKSESSDNFLSIVKDYPISTNFFYISRRQGPIFYHAGNNPVRIASADPRLPLRGDGTEEWSGILASEYLPVSKNAVRGYFIDWNSKPSVGWSNGEKCIYWGAQNRVEHAKNFLDTDPDKKFTFRDLGELDRKFSYGSIYASSTKNFLTGLLSQSADAEIKEALKILVDWDNEYSPSKHKGFLPAGELLFNQWMNEFAAEVFPDLKGDYFRYVVNDYGAPLIYRVIAQENLPYDFLKGRKSSDVCELALKRAYESLKSKYGDDSLNWKVPVEPLTYAAVKPVMPGSISEKTSLESFYPGKRASSLMMWEASKGWVKGVSILPPGEGNYIQDEYSRDHSADQVDLYNKRIYKPILFYEEDVWHHTETEKYLEYTK